MKLLQFRSDLKKNFIIIKLGIIYAWQNDTAYWSNNWGNILSTIAFTISTLIYFQVLYANTTGIVGYSKDQMLLFLLIGQIMFYSVWIFYSNIRDLIQSINTGQLDLVLTKPLPALSFVLLKNIPVFGLLRDGLAPSLIIGFSINWSILNIQPWNLVSGALIYLLGVNCLNA